MTPTENQSAAPFNSEALSLLNSLKGAHRNLRSAINELELLTNGPPPGHEELARIRWHVSKASLDRRLLWGRIHFYLSKRVSAEAEKDLRQLQENDMLGLRMSTAHLSDWTTETILKDWPGYCRASAIVRSKMIDFIGTEKRLLFPILQRAALHGGNNDVCRSQSGEME